MHDRGALDILDQGSIELHRHRSAYLTISKSAGYCELAIDGQIRVTPGTVIVHPRFHLHSDQVEDRGTVWNIEIDPHDAQHWGAFRSAAIERLAQMDRAPEAEEILDAISDADPLESYRPPDWLKDFVDLKISQFDEAQSEFSREYAHRRFKRHFGMAPGQYRRERQLQCAVSLIESGHALAGVAAEAGFTDQSHMTRVMKRALGLTPGALRSKVTPVQEQA